MNLGYKEGIKAGVPVMVGYFPVAMAFGILSKGNGFNFMETFSFSFILYAGASQFIGVSMLALGAGMGEVVLATLLLNFRHFFMSASLVEKLHHVPNALKPILGFFVTDEVFSVASFTEGELTSSYLLTLEVVSYISWVTGTCLGFIMGNFLPEVLQVSMGIGLYALFVSIIVPEIKKNQRAIVLTLMAGLINTVFRWGLHFPQGWSVVLTIVVVSSLGVVIYRKETS